MIADPVDIAHLSAHCQPAPEKLEADVCAEAGDGERRCRRELRAPAAAMIASPGMPREHGTTRNESQMVT
jgi:hypothetical protein